LVCRDINIKEIYVGATTNWIKRKGLHKCRCTNENYNNSKVYQYIRANNGWKNWNMIMIEKYPCETQHESAMRERFWTETLGATLNSNVQGRTNKEYQETHKEKIAEYRETHKEEAAEYQAEYRETHKEQIAEYRAEYKETHKEQIAEYQAEYHAEYQEIHKEQLAEKSSKYYWQNKEQILEKRKNKYTCKCGLIICNSSKSQHNKSIKHIKFMLTLK
jgi:hypothetical protein